MKIGILSFPNAINYGAYFQLYAMQEFLKENGFNCEIIHYKKLGFTIREYFNFINPIKLPPWKISSNLKKIAAFKNAHKKFNFTRRIFNSDHINKMNFDKIVLGSDEIWNFKTKLIGYDPAYFSKGLPGDKVIAYGASFGAINISDNIPQEIISSLNTISKLSVRDDNSLKIIEKISSKTAEIVLDPTFLTNIGYDKIIPEMDNAILVYGFFDNNMITQIKEYAAKEGKKTVSVGYRTNWTDINLDRLDPFEWASCFQNCDSVVTTMYHGMLFALMNKKRFCIFSTPYRANKIGSFLSDLDLENRIIKNNKLGTLLNDHIDYDHVNHILRTKADRSRAYLLGALQ